MYTVAFILVTFFLGLRVRKGAMIELSQKTAWFCGLGAMVLVLWASGLGLVVLMPMAFVYYLLTLYHAQSRSYRQMFRR